MDWLDIKEFFKDAFKYIVIALIILFIFVFVLSVTQVVGDSMNPTLKNGDIMIVNKLKYRFSKVKRGDIISLKYADTKYLIKRVIGMPGDNIEIINSTLYINGKIYQEEYLKPNMSYKDFKLSELGYNKIPENMYLVLGDNREISLDSRQIGLVKKEDINGKISFRFWPLNKLKFF